MYSFDSRVRFSEVDHTKCLTLPGIVNYFQDCSTFHSEDIGLGVDYFAEHQKAWVLSSWQVVVDRRPLLGEPVTVHTWPTDFNGLYGIRNFCMKDNKDKNVAYANSIWVFMDMKKGRPSKPSPEDIARYGTEPPMPMHYEPRKIKIPDSMEERPPLSVRRDQIDTNEHVNNCQYVQMAMEILEWEAPVRQMRAEYKRSAVMGSVIYPRLAVETDRIVVTMSDEDNRLYAVVELKENIGWD